MSRETVEYFFSPGNNQEPIPGDLGAKPCHPQNCSRISVTGAP